MNHPLQYIGYWVIHPKKPLGCAIDKNGEYSMAFECEASFVFYKHNLN